MRKTRICRGFTMIELLIVVVIITILMTVAMIAMRPILERVARVRCGAQLSAVLSAYMSYVTQHSKYFPPLYDPKEYDFVKARQGVDAYSGNPFDNYFITNRKAYFSAGFGPLVAHGLIKSEYFVCPGVADTEESWWRKSSVADAEYWWQEDPNPNPENAWRERKTISDPSFASYCIRHRLYPWTPAQVSSAQDKETNVATQGGVAKMIAKYGRRAILADNLTKRRMVEERHGNGVNAAYIDGSVEFCDNDQFMEILQGEDKKKDKVSETELDILWYLLDSGRLPDD